MADSQNNWWADQDAIEMENYLDQKAADAAAQPKLLRDVLPKEFFAEFMDTRAATMLDCEVAEEVYRANNNWKRWPGPAKNVAIWWKLVDGRCVGWNENESRGWSFPVFGSKNKGETK